LPLGPKGRGSARLWAPGCPSLGRAVLGWWLGGLCRICTVAAAGWAAGGRRGTNAGPVPELRIACHGLA